MLEFILPNSPSEVLSPREVYVTLSDKELKIFEDIQQRVLESFKLTNLNWLCDKEFPCLPSEMLEFYRFIRPLNFIFFLLIVKTKTATLLTS